MPILNNYPTFTPDPNKSVEENLQAFMHACAEQENVPKNEGAELWFQQHVVQMRKHYEENYLDGGKLELSDPFKHAEEAITAYMQEITA